MNGRIFLLAMFYGVVQTAYFGWHFLPSSDAAIICDGITLLIGALAWVVPSNPATGARE